MDTELFPAHVYEPGEPYQPTLLLLHGTGGNEEDLLPLGRSLWPGAGLLSPRGAVLENGLPRFFRRLEVGVFDLPDLHRRTADLEQWLSLAAQDYAFAADDVIAVGYSNGANLAASLLLTSPDCLRGAVLFRAMTPFEPERHRALNDKPIFIAGGRDDRLATDTTVENLAQLLRVAGGDVELHWSDGGHALLQTDVEAARQWLLQKLVRHHSV